MYVIHIHPKSCTMEDCEPRLAIMYTWINVEGDPCEAYSEPKVPEEIKVTSRYLDLDESIELMKRLLARKESTHGVPWTGSVE